MPLIVPSVMAQPLTLNTPALAPVTGQYTYTGDDTKNYLFFKLAQTAPGKATQVVIPIEAIPDRKRVYSIGPCLTSPGGYCVTTPFCATCQQAIQKCMDEHVTAGRI